MTVRPQLILQQDAFAASPIPSAAAPAPAPAAVGASAFSQARSIEPAPQSSALEPLELWLAVHLPQLTEIVSSHSEPGEAYRRRRVLERLATQAQSFTSRVSLAQPDGLLLEIKGSLRLFSGVENICRLLSEEHRVSKVHSVIAVAPTPLAALARARTGHTTLIMDRARLVGSVTSLPLNSLRWPLDTIARLAKVGVYTAGQALRLPRAGFARRFGTAQLASLDKLTGRLPDPRMRFLPRERFRRLRDLSYEIENHETLLRVLQPLLGELESFLRARQAGITRLEFRFRHRNAAFTSCVLQLAAPAADAQRLGHLLGERLARLQLTEPVRACELRTNVAVPLTQTSDALWQPGEHGGEGAVEGVQLIEHLRARLSAQAVHGLQLVSDHRPEQASRNVEPTSSPAAAVEYPVECERPLWLFTVPQRLEERGGSPWYCGPLQVCGETQKERIETGSLERDYYVAVDVRSIRLWIFRERASPHRWFLHGMFG